MRDDLSHRCHTEPFFAITVATERSIATAGLVEPLQRLEWCEGWRARQDSNLRPSAPEADTLSS